MFFKKKDKEFTTWLKERFHKLETGIAGGNRQLADLNGNMEQFRSALQKHDMAIEDLLDEWAEKKSEEKDIKERFREYEQNECRLLELFEVYQDQLWDMKRFAGTKDDAWASQITLMEDNLKHYLRLCGIDIINECGVEADYSLYEVIKAVDTTDSGKDGQIAEVYRCGYLYKGKVKRKAQAAAYKRSEQEEE